MVPQPVHPTSQASPGQPDPTQDPDDRSLAAAVAAKAKATRLQCPSQSTLDPLERTAEKRFYGNPLGSREALGRPIASHRCPRHCFLRSLMLRPLPPPPPWLRPTFSCGESAPAHCVQRAPSLARAPGARAGAAWEAGAECEPEEEGAGPARRPGTAGAGAAGDAPAEEGSEGTRLRVPVCLGLLR